MAPKRPDLYLVPPAAGPATPGPEPAQPPASPRPPRSPELTPEQRALVKVGLPMLDRIVTSFARSRRLDEGEVYGVGALALAEAARQFRASAHLTFRHYAKTCIQGKLGRAFKRGGSLAVRVEDAMERAYFGVVGHQVLEVNLASDADEDLEKGMRAGSAEALAASYIASLLEGRQATPEEELLELEGRRVRVEELEAALAALHPHELEVIRAFYWEEKELKQVAEEIRAHENTAQNRHRRALTKLRERLVGRGS